jgi:hypothetical protein
MSRLKSFSEFESVNENIFAKSLVGLMTGDPEALKGLLGKFGDTGSDDATSGVAATGANGSKIGTTGKPGTGSKIGIATGNEDEDLETTEVPNREENIGLPETPTVTTPPTSGIGSDDFMLYMQHQQGVAGATGIIRASLGTGKMHPATLATRKVGRYGYLVGNVPSDRPNIKRDIIRALDAGDQKTGAKLFLEMWREKWHSLGQKALSEINSKPQIKAIIAKYCKQYGVPFDFATKVAYIESRFNPNVGNKTYKGLFALSADGFKKYSPGGNIFNPEHNAKAGIATLKENIRTFIKTMGSTVASVDISPWAKGLA